MAVTAQYTSPAHSLNVSHPINPSDTSEKFLLKALHQAILSTKADLNAFLTERKLEEDRANGVINISISTKRKAGDDESVEENQDEDGNGDEN